jgi:AcrR family transcriptional regulator
MTGLREQKKQQTRDAIVAVASKLFGKQGFQATTMEEIAAGAGVSAGTLYNYFGTKNTLLLAHLESRVDDMTETGSALLAAPPPDVVAAVQALTRLYLDRFISLERELLREVMAASFGSTSELLPELMRLDELLFHQLETLLGHFAEAEDLQAGVDVSEAATALYSLFATQLIMYVSVEAMTPTALRRAMARQIEIVFTGLRAQER